jgi:hypothetical protein
MLEYWGMMMARFRLRFKNVILTEVKNLRDPLLSLRMTPNPPSDGIQFIIPIFHYSNIPALSEFLDLSSLDGTAGLGIDVKRKAGLDQARPGISPILPIPSFFLIDELNLTEPFAALISP